MLKKALKKLSKVTSRSRAKVEKPTNSSKESPPSRRILTAEGWRRLMMKKDR